MRRSLFVSLAALAALGLFASQAVAADIVGTNGNDTIVGTEGNDNINGLAGHDWISGDDGGDVIIGSFGNDTLIGNDEGDHLYGRSGADKLWGEEQGCGFNPSGPTATGNGPTFTPCPSPDLDRFYGGTNNDVIHADDNPTAVPTFSGNPNMGEFVNCGGGTDVAWVDNNDLARAQAGQSKLFQTCETVIVNGSPLP